MPANYHLANEEIKSVNIQKDLGIFISDDLKWSNQIAHVVAKANRMLGFLRRHCTQLIKIHCRCLLYLTLVRSHLSYGSEIWSPQGSSRDLVLIEGIQRRATKFITQEYNSSYSSRLKSLNLLPAFYWFEIKDLTFYYKCKSGGYEVDVDQYSTQPSLHTTRFSSSDLRRPNLCKSSTFRSSYFNRMILLWNNLPSHIKSSNSCAIFKSKLYTYYLNKLNSDFDVERPRTWETICMKCRSSNITCCS